MTSRRKRRRKTCESEAPPELRGNLEVTRLNLLAFFRTLDRLHLAQNLPRELRTLFELDADLAEALWVLDQPAGRFNVAAMTQDSLASIEAVLQTLAEFLETLPLSDRIRVAETMPAIRGSLSPEAAYNQITGRDPAVE